MILSYDYPEHPSGPRWRSLMYHVQELETLNQQIRKRTLAVYIPTALLAAATLVTVLPFIRIQWLTVLLTILTAGLCIFCDGMFIAPLRAYRRHLDSALNGITHEMDCTFKSMESVTCLREGVTYYAMMVNIGDPKEEEDDRLLYYDAEKPLPGFEEGERLHITYHDKNVVAFTRG